MKTNIELKAVKRQEQAEKIKRKEKKGGTLAGHILRTKTARKYRGNAGKIINNQNIIIRK